MLQTLQRTLRRHDLVAPGAHLLLAVSGGADSTAMAVALAGLRRRYRLKLTLAHLHHGIRGADADEDARFVRRLARALKAGFMAGKADVPRRAYRSGVSLEMAAREARYDFLERAARRIGAEVIATAHTADDQAETVMLRLARGAGMQGLSGIPYRTERHGLVLVRPLLDVTRRQVEAFLRRRGVAWREDATNRDPAFLRNRVRHQVLPLLAEQLNPHMREALCRLADIAGEENRWMEREAARLGYAGSVADLFSYPIPLARRALRQWLGKKGIPPDALDFEAVERVRSLAAGSRGSRSIPLAGGWRAVRRAGQLQVERVETAAPISFRVRLRVPGSTSTGSGWRVQVKRGRGYADPGDGGAREAWVDAGRVGESGLTARSWRPGDRVRPLGLNGSKKVQDLFVDLKIPKGQRARVPVIECRGEIVWVPGSRVSRDWAVSGPQAPSLRLRASGPASGGLFCL